MGRLKYPSSENLSDEDACANESTTTKNAGKSLAISIAMRMRRYDAGHIARWSTSGASLEATGGAAAMVDEFVVRREAHLPIKRIGGFMRSH